MNGFQIAAIRLPPWIRHIIAGDCWPDTSTAPGDQLGDRLEPMGRIRLDIHNRPVKIAIGQDTRCLAEREGLAKRGWLEPADLSAVRTLRRQDQARGGDVRRRQPRRAESIGANAFVSEDPAHDLSDRPTRSRPRSTGGDGEVTNPARCQQRRCQQLHVRGTAEIPCAHIEDACSHCCDHQMIKIAWAPKRAQDERRLRRRTPTT